MTDAAPGARAPESPEEYEARLLAALGGREPLAVLRATPAALRSAVQAVAPERRHVPESPGKWSVAQVVQHLADSEIVGAFRLRMTLAHERPPMAAYDQERWAACLGYDRVDVDAALALFEQLRNANVRLLEGLEPADHARVGVHEEHGDQTVDDMMRNYAGHDEVHLRQIARIRRAIGA